MKRAINPVLLTALLLTTATTAFCDASADYYNEAYARQNKGDLDGAIADYTSAAAELKYLQAH